MGTRDVVVVVQKDDHSLGYFDFAAGAELQRVLAPKYPHEFAIGGRIRTPPGPVRIARRGPPPQVVA